MMSKEDSIMIEGVRYTIQELPGNEIPRVEEEECPVNSRIYYFQQLIKLREDMHQDVKSQNILYHLVDFPLDRFYFHRQMEEKGLKLELFCSRVAHGLYSVFRENREILKKILIEYFWDKDFSLLIHGKHYKVKQVELGDTRLNNCQGKIDSQTQEIFLNKQLKIDTKNIALLHEVLHQVINDSRILDPTVGKVKDKWEIEEPVIEIVSMFLIGFIKNNPGEFEKYFLFSGNGIDV